MATIKIDQLNVFYKKGNENIQVLHNFNLSIPQGLIYAIVGPSGCGKSTLLYTLAGIITNYTGTLTINEEKPNPKKQSIGLVPQHYGLLPWKKISSNIHFPQVIRKKQIDSIRELKILEQLQITHTLQKYPNELSGGEQQRVALARAFIQNPDLLLLDEPFSALDALTAEKSRSLFVELWNEHPVTTVLITHNIREAIELAHKIVLVSPTPGTVKHILNYPSEKEVRNKIKEIW